MKSHFSLQTVLPNNQKAPKENSNSFHSFLDVFQPHFGGGGKEISALHSIDE